MAGGVTPVEIWAALRSVGASAVQAAGIMGNMFYESSWNPEARALDTNGAYSDGLVQWNEASYPSAHNLVTGNPAGDLIAQARFLAQTGGLSAASGGTAAQAGGNFAANYERCAGCQPGGSQWQQRSAKAAAVLAMAQSGHWPNSSGVTGTVPGGMAGNCDTSCLICVPLPSISVPFIGSVGASGICLFHKSEARAVIGGLALAGGAAMFVIGTAILAAFGLRTTGAAKGVGNAIEAAGGAVAVIPGAEAAGAGIAVAGSRVKKAGQEGAAQRATQRRARRSERAAREVRREVRAGPVTRERERATS